ncbi:Adenosylcobinamide-phosphate synthase, partial [hydrothermal vent metagenome]
RLKGVLGLLILVLPLVLPLALLLVYLKNLSLSPVFYQFTDIVIIYLAVGRKSLREHALNVLKPLEQGDLDKAREKISLIVSRDTHEMSQPQVIIACLESIIENSNDAIFGVIIWYLIGGAPGVLVYRLVNTLDAMWGYKNERFLYFGWAAARLDDVLNWLPARLSVFSFALVARGSEFNKVWQTAFQQGGKCSSKNAGPVMSAGACALNIKLGGKARYNGVSINKPDLGYGNQAGISDIKHALLLIDKTLLLWLGVLVGVNVVNGYG